MIEDMKDEDILDKARMEGMNQGIWLAVQELAHDGRWTQAAEVSGFITSWLSFGNRKAIIGAAEMRKCLDKIFDLAIDERLK